LREFKAGILMFCWQCILV